MEKIFTLMKTLTAVCSLVFPRKKSSCAVTNEQTPTGGCGNGTTVDNDLIYANDPDKAGSFLFFNQAVNSQESAVGSLEPSNNEEKLKSKEELKKVNDELAQRNIPKPVNNNWRQRVNDDMAACTAVDDPMFPPVKNSYKRKNENINVYHIFTINDTTTAHNETRTSKNDSAWAGSFSFLSVVMSVVLRSFKQDQPNQNLKPVFIPVRPYNKSKIRH